MSDDDLGVGAGKWRPDLGMAGVLSRAQLTSVNLQVGKGEGERVNTGAKHSLKFAKIKKEDPMEGYISDI